MKIYHRSADALTALGLPPRPDLQPIDDRYPVRITDYYLGLIDPVLGDADPIYRQCLPDSAELADTSSSFDPLSEVEQMPVPRLIHRFADRAVLLVTTHCLTHCRFCFRKRGWMSGAAEPDISDAELTAVAAHLRQTPAITEILISGGDPLTLGLERIRQIIETLRSTGTIRTIRLATRLPAVAPDLITAELASYLGGVPGLWLATHFNHPREITDKSSAALTRLVRAGVPVINQTVLLKGVNDRPEILEELFRALIGLRVKPHYLFHVDPVRGVRHFATGIQCGLDILRAFRPRLSSLAVPTFAIDLPEGGGKVALQPDYRVDGQYPDIQNSRLITYPEPQK